MEAELEEVKLARLDIDVDRWTWWGLGISMVLVGLTLLLGFLKFTCAEEDGLWRVEREEIVGTSFIKLHGEAIS